MGHGMIETVGPKIICRAWESPQHLLFQMGNVFVLLSFLVPLFKEPTHAQLFERVTLSIATLFLGIWGWMILPCQGDVVLWNLLFAFGHGFLANLLIWKAQPKVMKYERDSLIKGFFERVNVTVKETREVERKGGPVVIQVKDSFE